MVKYWNIPLCQCCSLGFGRYGSYAIDQLLRQDSLASVLCHLSSVGCKMIFAPDLVNAMLKKHIENIGDQVAGHMSSPGR